MEFSGGPLTAPIRTILEAFDNCPAPNAVQQARRYSNMLPGNNGFYPTSLGSGFANNLQDGTQVRRTSIVGAAHNGAIIADSTYGAPLAQIFSTRWPADNPRPLRRYTYAATVLMSAVDANAFVEIGWKTNASRAETNAATWGVMACVRGASTWAGGYKLASGGAWTNGVASGLAPTAPRRITLTYEESASNPTITVKVGNQTILTLAGAANMPQVANGPTLTPFACSPGGYSVGAPGAAVQLDVWDSYFKVEEIG